MRVPDILPHLFALFVPPGSQAEQLDSAIPGIVGIINESLVLQSTDYLCHAAFGNIELLRNTFDGHIPLTPEEKKTADFRLRDLELTRQKTRLHMAALDNALDEFLYPPGLVMEKFPTWFCSNSVHSENDYKRASSVGQEEKLKKSERIVNDRIGSLRLCLSILSLACREQMIRKQYRRSSEKGGEAHADTGLCAQNSANKIPAKTWGAAPPTPPSPPGGSVWRCGGGLRPTAVSAWRSLVSGRDR